MLLVPPNGRDEVFKTYGDPRPYVFNQPAWESKILVTIPLPSPLALSNGLSSTRIRCHSLLAENFQAVFEEIYAAGLWHLLKTNDGIYCFRPKRTSRDDFSMHTWGAAFDNDAEEYPLGSFKRQPAELEAIWTKHKFTSGADFKGTRDPMHHQFGTNY